MSVKRKTSLSFKLSERAKRQKQMTLDDFSGKQKVTSTCMCDNSERKTIKAKTSEIPNKINTPEADITEAKGMEADKTTEDHSTLPHSKGFQFPRMKDLNWKKISAENLDLDYCILFSRKEADNILRRCEEEVEYNTGMLAKVHVYGKWHSIPRKQVAFGDEGLAYTFSNNTVPARPWTLLLREIRDQVTAVTGHDFNFVLINRYQDGNDYMGEHRDDEKDLDRKSPIASLSFGQKRDFIFRHGKSRGKGASMQIQPVKLELEHGALLMMNYPTNQHWYHSLPQRKRLPGVRINMTFRKMIT